MKYFNYSTLEEALKGSGFSPALKKSIDSFLQDAALEVKKDIEKEGKERVYLVQAENFNNFVRTHQDDFEAFGKFISDYQGAYAYDWANLYAVAHCIFMFKVKMPGKVRLIELTARFDWVLYALENESICRYIIKNFSLYANMMEKFLDENGDVLPILEIVYHKLLKMASSKEYPTESAQYRLRDLLYQYTFADLT